jgi:hypothetical protein
MVPMGRLPLLVCLLAASCSSWRPVANYDQWTLYELPNQAVPVERFASAFAPAFVVVEEALGPFEGRVAVHAWDGSVQVQGAARSPDQIGTGVHEVPGIGPARIQAYHARGGNAFSRSGVFIGSPDPGTAVHELVHARFAELDADLPLWLEEGIAGLLGDGLLVDDRWVVDGLACWPMRELREETLDDLELARLLALSASDAASVRDNVLMHFVGWAVVFDCYRESEGRIEWRRWARELEQDPLTRVRARMARSLAPGSELEWLTRLSSPEPGRRLAAAKGLWKLRSREVLDLLLVALEQEQTPEVRVGLAVNTLAAAGELSLGWHRWRAVEGGVREALGAADLTDPEEQRAALELYRAYRHGDHHDAAQDALRRLSRFWEE